MRTRNSTLMKPSVRTKFVRSVLVAAWIFSGCLAVETAPIAAELPQVLAGPNARFSGAELPQIVNAGRDMIINQTADRATLHWQSFDIGTGHSVEFRQPSSSSVALNRIFDSVPSEISGSLSANGQIYLINQNGILFRAGAQVNTQSLVASTLDVDDRVFEEIGFVNAINERPDAIAAFDSFGKPMGEIRIANGASIETQNGGRVLIFAPVIVNEGRVNTPEGQQVFAASEDKVWIAASDDQNLRGLVVEVSTGGEVTNLGEMIAERGNVTMLGLAVNQDGIIRATTSVSLNGSVRLLAQDMNGSTTSFTGIGDGPRQPNPIRGGELRVGPGSITEVMPDQGDAGAVDAQTQPVSRIDLSGKQVVLESGSRLVAVGGDISIKASARTPRVPQISTPGEPDTAGIGIIMENGATIDVSGDDTTVVSVARNIVDVEARGNELADSPQQRDGPIRNQTLQVDARYGTKFLNIDGATASVERSAAERLSTGGTITLLSEGAVTINDGAMVDVSGGSVTNEPARITTSQLETADGRIVDISLADPNQRFRGVIQNSLFSRQDPGYVEGKDAGTLRIEARGLTLDGAFAAGTTVGPHQRWQSANLGNTPKFARPFDQLPVGGSFNLSLLQAGKPTLFIGGVPQNSHAIDSTVLSSTIINNSGFARLVLGNAGPVVVGSALELPSWGLMDLTGTEVSILDNIRIPGGSVTLNNDNSGRFGGAALTLNADLLTTIDAHIDLSGVWVNDNPDLLIGEAPSAPIVLDGGSLDVGSGASIIISSDSVIDVSAGAFLEFDGKLFGGNGGSIKVETGEIDDNSISPQLRIGAELRGYGFEQGGTLDISTGRVRVVPEEGAISELDISLDGARQFSNAAVTGESGVSQFILELGAGTFQQGGFQSFRLTSTRADLAVMSGADMQVKTAGLRFNDGVSGTSGIRLTGNQISRGSSTVLQAGPVFQPTGTPLGEISVIEFRPDFERRPASLTLASNNSLAGAIGATADLTIDTGAVIAVDPGGRVELESTTNLFINGAISAPAGEVAIIQSGGSSVFQPERMIWLGPESILSADGAVLVDPFNDLGLLRGSVLAAGRISVRAEQGSIVGAPGALISVDGMTAALDIGEVQPNRSNIAGAAGTIELLAAESLLYTGSLRGRAGADTAEGGRLVFRVDPGNRNIGQFLVDNGASRGPHTIVIDDFNGPLPGRGEAVDASLQGTGFLPVSQLSSGGFDSLELSVRSSSEATRNSVPIPDTPDSLPIITFVRDIDLAMDRSIVLDAGILQTDAAQVSLAAPYISLGSLNSDVQLDGVVPDKIVDERNNIVPATEPIRLMPTTGPGKLHVSAQLIDLSGELVTQGFGDTSNDTVDISLNAVDDLRMIGVRYPRSDVFSGLFRTAGDLSINAQRVYPATLTEYAISIEGDGGELDLTGGRGEISRAPLSIGGKLTLNADVIEQGTAVFAPLGELNLHANLALRLVDCSLTSTSAFGVEAPFFRTEPGGALILPVPAGREGQLDQLEFVESVTNAAFQRKLPSQRINLDAPAIELQPGSLFDLSGGGDVRATEFIPGPGGSRDILLADAGAGIEIQANASFAIVPSVGQFAPWDPLESPAAKEIQGIRIGDTLVLEEGFTGLPAGEYAILPARYALFGGYLVTPEPGTKDMKPGTALTRLDGAPVLAGRFGVAGSDAADSRTQGFAIESGDSVRNLAEYRETALDDLFIDNIARTPADAGSLVIRAGDRLQLQSQLVARQTTIGLGSVVDIATNTALSIVTETNGGNNIELRTTDLEGLGADSLLIGGTRSSTSDGTIINAIADELLIEPGVKLENPELLLVGNNVEIRSLDQQATRLVSTGSNDGDQETLIIDGDAAFVAVSERELNIVRNTSGGTALSSLRVDPDASLSANGSIVLDAGGDVDVAGTLSISEGVVSLGASSISLGETDGQALAEGLILSTADLQGLRDVDLRLRSSSLISIFGGVDDQSVEFQSLTLDTQALIGQQNTGRSVTMTASQLELKNSTGELFTGLAPVAGSNSELNLGANEVLFGDGHIDVLGYEQVVVAAGSNPAPIASDGAAPSVMIAGDSDFFIGGNLRIEAPVISSYQTANSAITAAGSVTVIGGDSAARRQDLTGLAASLVISGSTINFGGRVDLPSGAIELRQVGDAVNSTAADGIIVASGAILDVSGETLDFDPALVGTGGGLISLDAETGDVVIESGARLDVTGVDAGGQSGILSISAPHGDLVISSEAELVAHDGGSGTGRFDANVAHIIATDAAQTNAFGVLNTLLDTGNFYGERKIRVHTGDIVVNTGSTVRAGELRLIADTGRIQIDGTLDVSGDSAGSIWLAAGDSLDINGRLMAVSSNSDADGGRIDLYALDADDDDPAGTTDFVNLFAGSEINVSGGAGAHGGDIFVHTRRLDTDSDNQTDQLVVGEMNSQVIGARHADLVATKTITDPNATQVLDPQTGEFVTQATISSTDIALWRNEAEIFIQNTPMSSGAFRIAPGLAVESTGDLELADSWNFFNDWYFGRDLSDPMAPNPGTPGIVTLRAARNLNLNANLTDAFATTGVFLGFFQRDQLGGGIPRQDINGNVVETLTPESWRYTIASGTDLNSADVLASGDSAGDLRLNSDVVIRTGTADIDIAASGDISLADGAAIYTAGWNKGTAPVLDDQLAPVGLRGDDLFALLLNGGQFPVDGGNVTIHAGGDLKSNSVAGEISSWLTRIGKATLSDDPTDLASSFGAIPTHWSVVFDQFGNGIGSFGGGDLHADVGGNLQNVTIALPTTGRTTDGLVVDTSASEIIFQPSQRTVEILGGGNLRLDVGGDIAGGQVVLGRGQAQIRNGGDTTRLDENGHAPVLFVGGSAQVEWITHGKLTLGGIQDPTVGSLSESQLTLIQQAGFNISAGVDAIDNLFYTYNDATQVRLVSLASDLILDGPEYMLALPPNLAAASLGGNLIVAPPRLEFFPSETSRLEFLARDNIENAGGGSRLIQSDQDRAFLPSIDRPELNSGAPLQASVPVHANDDNPNLLVAQQGSILSDPGASGFFWEMELAKQSLFRAGIDISNLSIRIQHATQDSTSSFIAGRNIEQSTLREVTGQFKALDRRIFEISGPGSVEFVAGRSISLGTSAGIETIGNTRNSALPDEGAAVQLWAGLGGEPAYDAFIDTFLVNDNMYKEALTAFLVSRDIAVSDDPVAAFDDLTRTEQRLLLADILFAELKESGVSAQADGSNDFTRGFDAITTLFPEADPDGGINLLLSQVQTLAGGDLKMLVPGGSINAGAADADIIDKNPEDLGIVTARGGDIDIFVDEDLLVNSTRAFALQGDLLVWSSNGSIDAGKGAKTVTSIPDPITRIDPTTGDTIIEFPPVVSGSGLQGESAFLFAPRGAVNAGDAGIRTAGNLTIGAVEVIGGDNIDVGGVAIGVPIGDAVAVTPPGLSDSSSAATQSAENSAGGMLGEENKLGERILEGTEVAFITVDILSFGEDYNCGPEEDC